MDLNEKIAARRRELEAEAKKVASERTSSTEDAAGVDAEAARRLKGIGIDPKKGESADFEKRVQKKIADAIEKAATARAWKSHGPTMIGLTIGTVLLWWIFSWVLGAISLVVSVVVWGHAIDKHKKDLLGSEKSSGLNPIEVPTNENSK